MKTFKPVATIKMDGENEILELYGPWFPNSDEPETCPDCGGLTSGGMTVDPDKCCFYCRAD